MLGTGVYVVILGVMALSFPLSVLASMHLFEWTWWSASIAMTLIWIIPVVGQLAYVGLAFAGAFFLYQANFDWQSVAYPEPKTISIAAMTPEQFDRFKKNMVPQFERYCKQEALAQNSVDGKLPIPISKRCECIARVLPDIFSRDEFAYLESHDGQPPQAGKDRVRSAVAQRCD